MSDSIPSSGQEHLKGVGMANQGKKITLSPGKSTPGPGTPETKPDKPEQETTELQKSEPEITELQNPELQNGCLHPQNVEQRRQDMYPDKEEDPALLQSYHTDNQQSEIHKSDGDSNTGDLNEGFSLVKKEDSQQG